MEGQTVDTVTNAAQAVSALTLEQRVAGLIILVWSLTWKGIALWQSARSKQKWWFIAILVLNTIGIFELIYLLFFYRTEEGYKKRFDFSKIFKFAASKNVNTPAPVQRAKKQ